MTKKLPSIDLTKLSREEKLAIIDAVDEKKRRALEKRDGYVPNAGQAKVHQSDKLIRAVFAGNGGGKTTLGVQEAMWAATGFNQHAQKHTKVPCRVIVVLDRPEKVADVWLPEIKKWWPLKPEQLHKRGRAHYNQITFDNGSEILFMFHDQDPMAFESIEVDAVIFDEPPPRPIYVALMRGGRKKGSKPWYLIIGTPIAAAWMRTELYEPWVKGEKENVECFKYGTALNKQNLREGYMEDFGSALSEKEKRIRFEGEFFDLEGLALAHLFDREKHIRRAHAIPHNWPCVVAVDPHPRKAHCAVLLAVTPYNQLIAVKELVLRAPPREFGRALLQWMSGYKVVDIVCDSLGSSELTGGDGVLSFISVVNQEIGGRMRATSYSEKLDENWIAMIQDVLLVPQEPDNFGKMEPKLVFFADCKILIHEVETVQWMKYRNLDEYKPKLDITNKDVLSCLKYALATQPKWVKGREKPIRIAGRRI